MAKSREAFRTISEVAEWLDVQTHVLRFWESKFSQVKPVKRAGGRRYYRPQDMELLGGLKKLLHEDGMSIKDAQKTLKEKGVKHVSSLSHPVDEAKSSLQDTTAESADQAVDTQDEAIEAVAEAPAVETTDQQADADLPEQEAFETADESIDLPSAEETAPEHADEFENTASTAQASDTVETAASLEDMFADEDVSAEVAELSETSATDPTAAPQTDTAMSVSTEEATAELPNEDQAIGDLFSSLNKAERSQGSSAATSEDFGNVQTGQVSPTGFPNEEYTPGLAAEDVQQQAIPSMPDSVPDAESHAQSFSADADATDGVFVSEEEIQSGQEAEYAPLGTAPASNADTTPEETPLEAPSAPAASFGAPSEITSTSLESAEALPETLEHAADAEETSPLPSEPAAQGQEAAAQAPADSAVQTERENSQDAFLALFAKPVAIPPQNQTRAAELFARLEALHAKAG